MSLRTAIQTQSREELVSTVAKAVSIYGAKKPDEPSVETVHGVLPISAIFDSESKWQLVAIEYANITQCVKRLPEAADKNVETAKMIALSPTLRWLTEVSEPSSEDLL